MKIIVYTKIQGLGFKPMSDINTARVLSLPGGGTRGFLQNHCMKLFCQQSGIPEDEIWKYFNCISGTSVGGLGALAYAFGLTPDTIYDFYMEQSPWLFTIRTAGDIASGSINASVPSNRPNSAQKVIILGQNDQFYNAVDPVNSNYGGARLRTALDTIFGDATLQDLKTNVIIPAYQSDTNSYILFSNLDVPGLTGKNELIKNVALATSAAHFYLPPHVFGGHTYLDGGVFQNNPSRLGLSLAKQIKPIAKRFCVLTIGCGVKPELGLEENDPGTPFPYENTVKTIIGAFDSALEGNSEAVHSGLLIESQYSLSGVYYYMTRPVLDPEQNTELDNTDPDYYEYLTNTAENWFATDEPNISNFTGHLLA